ncbi:GrpB family protein [Sinorhizobium chiapasense]
MSRITLVEYDPCWPSLFEERAVAVTTLLSPFVSEIHHIGSTAVPGLAAKPKIDIDVVVSDQRMLPELGARLRSAGYTFHGDPYADGLWTFTADTRPCGTRLYLCGTDNAAHAVRLRDALREHKDLARRYETLKRRLANEAKGDWDIYTNGKHGFVNEVLTLVATKKGPAVASGAL